MLLGAGYSHVLLLATASSARPKAVYPFRVSSGYAFTFPSGTFCDEPKIDSYWFLEGDAHCITDSDGWRTGICKHELPFYSYGLVRRFFDELQSPRGGGG